MNGLSAEPTKSRPSHVAVSPAFQSWAARHRVAAAALGGLVGVHVASLTGFWLGGFGLTRLDYSTANGMVYLPNSNHFEQFLAGTLSHYADGPLFAIIFAIGLAPLLPLPATPAGNLGKALIFGSVLALLALFVTAPFVFGPSRGVFDPLIAFHSGWQYVVSVFVFHWVYALHLGLIYNAISGDQTIPTRDSTADARL